MNLLHQGSLFGESPHYLAQDERVHASSLRELLGRINRDSCTVDTLGLRQYFERRPDGIRTCFQRAERLPAGFDLYEDGGRLRTRCRDLLPPPDGPLLPLLEECIVALLAGAENVAVALSGGLDSALVLSLVRRLTGRAVPILTIATGLPGYCELEETLATARTLDCGTVDVIQVESAQIIDALPNAIAACETPLFNLHPVSKLLLARGAAQRGFDAIITGDGADQVFAGSDARNYIPIVGAMVRASGVKLLSPFFDERIAAWAGHHGTDPGKTALRHAAATVLPSEITRRKKNPRLAPEFLLENFRDETLEAQLAPQLDLRPPAAGPGPEQTLWATTAILIRHLGGIY